MAVPFLVADRVDRPCGAGDPGRAVKFLGRSPEIRATASHRARNRPGRTHALGSGTVGDGDSEFARRRVDVGARAAVAQALFQCHRQIREVLMADQPDRLRRSRLHRRDGQESAHHTYRDSARGSMPSGDATSSSP